MQKTFCISNCRVLFSCVWLFGYNLVFLIPTIKTSNSIAVHSFIMDHQNDKKVRYLYSGSFKIGMQ